MRAWTGGTVGWHGGTRGPTRIQSRFCSRPFSAALWLLVIKHADAEPDTAGANRLTQARAIADRAAEDLAASLRKAA